MSNLWHIKNWIKVGKNFSWKLSFYTLGGFLGLFYKNKVFFKLAQKKHEYILSYLKNDLHKTIDNFKEYKESSVQSDRKNIWTLWWQGEEKAPELVRACIRSMKENANGATLHVLTESNIKDYLEIPPFVSKAKEQGILSMANFTDILRLMLLEKYGGLWLDSTIFVSKPIPSEIFSRPFYSLHTKWDESTCYVQHNLYHIFVIGSKPQGKLVSFTKNMFFEYISKHNTYIDYFMLDYIFFIAYQTFLDVKKEIDTLPYSSERLYDLVHLLNKPFDDNEFKKLCDDCMFSKLDWHKKYKTKTKGQQTYYSKLIKLYEN